MGNNIRLSVVSPVYNAVGIVDELVRQISDEASRFTVDFEIILVDDNSPDNSWPKIAHNCAHDPRVKGIRLSRNFGQHYAITAGLDAAQGDYVVVIDCDLQDNPAYISQMIDRAKEGYDIVFTKRRSRKHSLLKNIFSSLYFGLYRFLSGSSVIQNNIGSYSLITRRVREEFTRIKDFHRHYILVLSMLGFRSSIIEIEHEERYSGRSSYNFTKLISHAINGITSQSVRLLRLSIGTGLAFVLLSFLFGAYIIYSYFTYGLLPGYASLMVTMLLGTGLILTSVGIAGIYIGKIFEQVKDRPLYIVAEKLNLK